MEATVLSELVELRKNLHRHAELAEEEFETQKILKSFLTDHGCEDVRKVASTGLLCVFDSKVDGPTILIRSEMDALPIQEINEFDYRSANTAVSHKCGHDGHASILAGLALELVKNPISKGKVALIFQPAEENGRGAKAILADPTFDFKPDMVFALHNLPGYSVNEIVCREGNFTAAVRSIIITLNGKTSHAAEPENGINPARALAHIIQMFEELSEPNPASDSFALATPIYVNMGEKAYGTSAGNAEIHYTLRTWDNARMEAFSKAAENHLKLIAQKEKLEIEISWLEEFAANHNSPRATQIIQNATEHCSLSFTERDYPFKWGEDFGLFTERFEGAMFGVGSGEDCPALHNPDYDFPDELIPTGVAMFTSILNQSLK